MLDLEVESIQAFACEEKGSDSQQIRFFEHIVSVDLIVQRVEAISRICD
jgi:hypothetical protein